MENYGQNLNDLEFLFSETFKLSARTTGRQVKTQREEIGSYIFAKIVITIKSILKLLPRSSLAKANDKDFEFWDISSVNVLTRALIDTYNVFYYLTIDDIPKSERNFRFALWEYHSEVERLKMLELIGSQNQRVQNLRSQINNLKNNLLNNTFYKSLKSTVQKGLKKGEKGIYLTNAEISKRAGIPPSYYRAIYKYLSNYVHTFSFSISQLRIFKAGDSESLHLLKTTIEYCILYTSLAVRDFVKIFPDQGNYLPARARKIILIWQGVPSYIDNRNFPKK